MTGSEQVLVNGWFQQFPSHSMGSLVFAPDGALLASSGEGGSWQYVDFGQAGNPGGDPVTIVRHAIDAAAPHGTWQLVADPTAADGQRMEHPDAGAPKVTTAAANPAGYFDVTFTAVAGRPYRLWLRGRAKDDAYVNDSVYVQFSGSVTSANAPIHRIGTTQAVAVVIEDCSGCGVEGWGWQDNGYGLNVLGPALYFTGGTQTMRIQGREDGISIDQIVLSPDTYLSTPPGAVRNDATVLPRTP